MVDLTKKSTYLYDAVTTNPIAFNAILTTNNYQANNFQFGLPPVLSPIATDGRVSFYVKQRATSSSNPALIIVGAGFFDENIELIPVYLPGEITLIKAEALARKNLLPEAIVELNKVLTKTPAADALNLK